MTPTRSDVVSRSGLLATSKALAALPAPIDQTRVDQLRQAIREGSYVIDPQAIARAMQDYPGE